MGASDVGWEGWAGEGREAGRIRAVPHARPGHQVPFKPPSEQGKTETRRAAQGPTAAKGQSWLESLAVPTQHPINAGKVGLLGFKSQKLKEIYSRCLVRGHLHFSQRDTEAHRGAATC